MFKITQAMVDEYAKAYPALNIMTEIQKMNLWFDSHQAIRRKNIKKFVNSWLSRAQDKAPSKKTYVRGCTRTHNTAIQVRRSL